MTAENCYYMSGQKHTMQHKTIIDQENIIYFKLSLSPLRYLNACFKGG